MHIDIFCISRANCILRIFLAYLCWHIKVEWMFIVEGPQKKGEPLGSLSFSESIYIYIYLTYMGKFFSVYLSTLVSNPRKCRLPV